MSCRGPHLCSWAVSPVAAQPSQARQQQPPNPRSQGSELRSRVHCWQEGLPPVLALASHSGCAVALPFIRRNTRGEPHTVTLRDLENKACLISR